MNLELPEVIGFYKYCTQLTEYLYTCMHLKYSDTGDYHNVTCI